MNTKEYLQYHREACDKLIAITASKNADYTGDSDDPFKNFRGVEQDGICSTEQGFLTRMRDKWSRTVSLVMRQLRTGEGARVKDETLEDTLFDFANYCILLAGWLRAKRLAADRIALAAAKMPETPKAPLT